MSEGNATGVLVADSGLIMISLYLGNLAFEALYSRQRIRGPSLLAKWGFLPAN